MALDKTSRSINIKSADGSILAISLSASLKSKILSEMFDCLGSDISEAETLNMPFPFDILEVVFSHMEITQEKDVVLGAEELQRDQDEVLADWKEEFIKKHNKILLRLIEVALFLDVEDLYSLCIHGLARKLKGKGTETMREILEVENDFSPEEEQQLVLEERNLREFTPFEDLL